MGGCVGHRLVYGVGIGVWRIGVEQARAAPEPVAVLCGARLKCRCGYARPSRAVTVSISSRGDRPSRSNRHTARVSQHQLLDLG